METEAYEVGDRVSLHFHSGKVWEGVIVSRYPDTFEDEIRFENGHIERFAYRSVRGYAIINKNRRVEYQRTSQQAAMQARYMEQHLKKNCADWCKTNHITTEQLPDGMYYATEKNNGHPIEHAMRFTIDVNIPWPWFAEMFMLNLLRHGKGTEKHIVYRVAPNVVQVPRGLDEGPQHYIAYALFFLESKKSRLVIGDEVRTTKAEAVQIAAGMFQIDLPVGSKGRITKIEGDYVYFRLELSSQLWKLHKDNVEKL